MPARFSFKLNGFDEASDELKTAMLEGRDSGLEKIGLQGEALLAKYTPIGATGNLAAGGTFEIGDNAVEIFIGPPADVYSAPVDLGTKPHFPPTSGLLLWVQRKLHVGNEKQAKAIAFMIARKISKRGTQGAHMFDKAFADLEPLAPGILEVEIAKTVEAAGFKVD